MKVIYFVRHAQSSSNLSGNFNEYDPGLSPEGKKEAEELKKKLTGIEFDLAYVSILKRAKETFELSEIKAKEVIITSICREHGFNEKVYKCDLLEGENWSENIPELRQRIKNFRMLLLENTAKKIIVITHNNFIREMLGANVKNGHYIIATSE